MINDLSKLISFESVLDKSEPNAPYGRGIASSLSFMLDRAKEYGLQTVNKYNYGYCQFNANNERAEIVSALCHLDVVPAGDLHKWNTNPFELNIKDGIMYGRGVADNKGAAVAVLHALKKLKQNKVNLKRHARLIFGCSEETDMSCIKAYVKNEVMPICSFVPDADFPIINSEKGIIQFDIEIDIKNLSASIEIEGGLRANMIPEMCKILVKNDKMHNKLNERLLNNLNQSNDDCELSRQPDGNFVVSCKGVSGHAMAPHKGVNAILKAFEWIYKNLSLDSVDIFLKLHSLFTDDDLKRDVGLKQECPDSGTLTLNPGIVKIKGSKLCLTVDARLPKTVNESEFIKILRKGFEKVELQGALINVINYKPNLYLDSKNPLISTLLSIYTKHTGLPGVLIKSGGGTYARELKNAVAFGPRFVGVKTDIHSPNEQYPESDFFKLVDIYYDAFIQLCS
ncbi:MAG: Sapep family Mn(2+)-dependent dipeptidase [Clostridiales bacterium]|jgi:succinyl-diaminopimelate desuccinylase|nr:Sapep family Mn(2+)-dependent dipeptidase [Clostridiales bacterium]